MKHADCGGTLVQIRLGLYRCAACRKRVTLGKVEHRPIYDRSVTDHKVAAALRRQAHQRKKI